MRQNIILECVETGERLYLTSKNKRNTPERLELKTYSPKLRSRAIIKEVKNRRGKKVTKWAYQLQSFLGF